VYLQTLGRQGQGPGELSQPFGIGLAGDHIVVHDYSSGKFVIWSVVGEHLGDPIFVEGRGPSGLVGLASGTLVGRALTMDETEGEGDFTLHYHLAIFSQEAVKIRELQEFPRFEPVAIRRAMPGGGVLTLSTSAPTPGVEYAATHNGDIYSTFRAEYQVHALDETGAMRWALRLPWERTQFTQKDIDELLGSLQESIADADVSEIEWPEQYPAIDELQVDGRGRLYVFPHFDPDDEPSDGQELPVDIYSREGGHLFSGWIPRISWRSARDDFIYSTRSDDETGEVRIIRYRLVWPGE
jgi:hypothetical protein